MTKDEIDVMWQKALNDSVRDGEQFTRYHFYRMVAKHTQEQCAKVCEAEFFKSDRPRTVIDCAEAIRNLTV